MNRIEALNILDGLVTNLRGDQAAAARRVLEWLDAAILVDEGVVDRAHGAATAIDQVLHRMPYGGGLPRPVSTDQPLDERLAWIRRFLDGLAERLERTAAEQQANTAALRRLEQQRRAIGTFLLDALADATPAKEDA